MGANELLNLVESLMSNTSKTEEGISCPFCMMPQKQIISHIHAIYHALLVRCGGMICRVRNEAEAIWRLLADNMDNMETWTFEQMAYAKMLAERRDMHKVGQEF